MSFSLEPEQKKSKKELRKEKIINILIWSVIVLFFAYAIIARLFFGLKDSGSSCDLSRGGNYYCEE